MVSTRKSLLPAIGVVLAVPVLAILPLRPAGADSTPPTAEAIGLSGTLPDFKTVEVDNSHIYDYTFTTAPTDWWVQSGVWEMTNRWSCSPGWSWFGGRSQETAAVWNKRHFSGDVSVQFYFAFKMGLSGSRRWDEYPSDAAVTICGDGRNLSSGYSFIVGADNNQRSILMRGDKVVAQSNDTAALLPTFTDGRPTDEQMHRRWWYVKINKIGPRVECWLDNKMLFTYDDPKPLDLGQVALWTYDNGIMLSRVQIYYANEQRPDYIKLVNHTLPATPSFKPAASKVQVASSKAVKVISTKRANAASPKSAKTVKVAELSRVTNSR